MEDLVSASVHFNENAISKSSRFRVSFFNEHVIFLKKGQSPAQKKESSLSLCPCTLDMFSWWTQVNRSRIWRQDDPLVGQTSRKKYTEQVYVNMCMFLSLCDSNNSAVTRLFHTNQVSDAYVTNTFKEAPAVATRLHIHAQGYRGNAPGITGITLSIRIYAMRCY